MAKKPLPLRIDEGLLARVDEARGDVSRTRFVERALEKALGDSSTAELLRSGGDATNSTVAGSTPARPASPRASKEDRLERAQVLLGRGQPKGYMPPRPKGGK